MNQKKFFPQSEGLQDEKNELLITPHLKDGQLPNCLTDAISIAPPGEMRDMLLLSVLTNCAYALPAMRSYHGWPRHCYGPELMCLILAPAASGKGIMNYGRKLLEDIEWIVPVYLPANISASALMEHLQMLQGKGIIMATEVDTLSQAMRSSFGGFSDVIRNIFEHETISQARRQNDEFIEIENPHVGVLLSGTHNQLRPLISNRENGLVSRFACYVVNSIQDFDDRVWYADEVDDVPAEKQLYARLSKELYARYQWMKKEKKECYFYFTPAQRQSIQRMFRSEYDAYSQEYGADFHATLKRMPVIMKRIGMILTGLRLDITQAMPERIVCSEEDFQTILLMGHKLLMHAAMVYQMIPAPKTQVVGEIGKNLLQKQFFQMLPENFTKQEAIVQASVLGIGNKTIDRWLQASLNRNEIQHVAHGKYSKNVNKSA